MMEATRRTRQTKLSSPLRCCLRDIPVLDVSPFTDDSSSSAPEGIRRGFLRRVFAFISDRKNPLLIRYNIGRSKRVSLVDAGWITRTSIPASQKIFFAGLGCTSTVVCTCVGVSLGRHPSTCIVRTSQPPRAFYFSSCICWPSMRWRPFPDGKHSCSQAGLHLSAFWHNQPKLCFGPKDVIKEKERDAQSSQKETSSFAHCKNGVSRIRIAMKRFVMSIC